MMKKIMTTVLVLALILAFMPPVQISANTRDTLFEIPRSVSAVRGRSVTVPITVTSNPNGFAAVAFEVGFTAGHMILDNARIRSSGTDAPGPRLAFSNFSIKNDEEADGTQWLSVVNPRNLTDWDGTGVFIELIFTVTAPTDVDRTGVDIRWTPYPNGAPVNAETGSLIPARIDNDRTIVNISTTSEGPDGNPPSPDHRGVTLANGGAGASGQGWYLPGATVTLNAGTAPTGQQFSHWTASLAAGVTFANANSATTTFVMPSNNVTITANWTPTGGGGGGGTTQGPDGNRPAGQFGVTLQNVGTGASGQGWYAPNATVNINAGTRTGYTFVNWTASPSTGVTFANATNRQTTFSMPSNDVTITANWTTGEGGNGGGGSGSGSGTAHPVLQHFGTWTGSGTREGRVNADHSRFVRLTRGGTEIATAHYTVTAGSTIITLNESYIATLADGTYVFRAEFTDGHADLNLIVSTGFGNVPQTGVADITLQVVAMWVSVFLAASLCVCLFFYRRETRKRTTDVRSYYGKQKQNAK